MDNCTNCNEPVNGNYCSCCGQPVKLKRIDRHYIMHEIAEVLYMNKGLFYTIKKMLISPAKSVQQYLTEDRKRYMKPIVFVIITSLIYTLVNHFFQIGIEDYTHTDAMEGSTIGVILSWTLENSGYMNLLAGFLMAFFVKLFFRKSDYNLFEIFILLCFLTGISALFFSFTTILQAVIHINLIEISTLIALIYFTWAIGQFFQGKKIVNYMKALLSYILAVFLYVFLVIAIGLSIDAIIK